MPQLARTAALFAAALFLAGCPAEEPPEDPLLDDPTPTPTPTPAPTPDPTPDDEPPDLIDEPDEPTEVEVSDEQISDADGNVLLTIDEVPDNVQPDPDTEFGGPTHFTDAVISDDGAWLAVGSAGVAHGYGSLYEIEPGEHHFVAFQFEGSVSAHSWSPDDRFALFEIGSPAEIGVLKLVDREDLAPHAADTGFDVAVDEEEGMDPPYAYDFTDWQGPHTLCFEFEGTPYCVDASTEEVEPAG